MKTNFMMRQFAMERFVKNEKNDCTVRAFACAAGVPYYTAHEIAAKAGRKNKQGFYSLLIVSEARKKGFVIERVTHIFDERAMTLSHFIKNNPKGRFLISIHCHALAIIDGIIHDDTPISTRKHVLLAWQILKTP